MRWPARRNRSTSRSASRRTAAGCSSICSRKWRSASPPSAPYLADARAGDALAEQLAALGDRLAELARSRALIEAVAVRQRELARPGHGLALPDRPTLAFHARTDRAASVALLETGAVLRAAGSEHPLGPLADAAEYVLQRPAVSTQELRARFAHHPVEEIDGLIALLTRLGLLRPYRPQL